MDNDKLRKAYDLIGLQNEKIEAQNEKIEELEDMVSALLNCFKILEGKVYTATASDVPVYGSCFGYLLKLSSGIAGSRWKRRWCVLESDGHLYYWKSVAGSTDPTADKATISLKGYALHSNEDETDLTIRLVSSYKKKYEFHAENREDKVRWTDALKAEIARINEGSPRLSPVIQRSMSVSSTGRESPVPTCNRLLLQKAEISGWAMRFIPSMGWKRCFAVLEDDRVYVYKSKENPGDGATLHLKHTSIAPIYEADALHIIKITSASGASHLIGFPDLGLAEEWYDVIGHRLKVTDA